MWQAVASPTCMLLSVPDAPFWEMREGRIDERESVNTFEVRITLYQRWIVGWVTSSIYNMNSNHNTCIIQCGMRITWKVYLWATKYLHACGVYLYIHRIHILLVVWSLLLLSWHLLVSYTLVTYSLCLRLAAQRLMTAQNNKLVTHNGLHVDVMCIPDLSQVFQSSSSHYYHNHGKACNEVRT